MFRASGRRPQRCTTPGGMGSRRLMAWEMSLVEADPAALLATAARQPHDPGFVPFVRSAQAAGIPIEIVSDGFGFFIEPALAALGVPELPVVTARTTFTGRRPSIAFPNGHPSCFVCGTCKRERVLAYRAAGRRVLFIGDGESDRYAAGYSDIVFAKRSLERICLEAGWPYQRWTAFSEIETWLADLLDVLARRSRHAPARRRRARRHRTATSAAPRRGATAWSTRRRGRGRRLRDSITEINLGSVAVVLSIVSTTQPIARLQAAAMDPSAELTERTLVERARAWRPRRIRRARRWPAAGHLPNGPRHPRQRVGCAGHDTDDLRAGLAESAEPSGPRAVRGVVRAHRRQHRSNLAAKARTAARPGDLVRRSAR